MASKNLKGITIEIGAKTTELNEALRKVDKQVYGLNGDLKALNQALKLDPKNTELLAQKQDVLQRNIKSTTDRLNTLKEAQRQMGDYASLTDEQKTKYNQLSAEISKSENALKDLNNELKSSNKVDLSKITAGLKKVGDVALQVAKRIAQVSMAVAGALAGVVTAGVKSYANLEKAQKGSERLFGQSFKKVQQNAKSAYKTLGLSATEYYDQVNQYAVGLKNALKGDTDAAADLSDSILKAQADIVSATGASQDSVQNAFSAVMRGNYTMLDNLRIGIKGSKEGMQEVIDKVNEWNKANGNATNYQMGNYADMENALVDYVKMVGVAGTAQKDMSSTISGSIQQLKAAWDNFLNGTGNADDLLDTFKNVAKNIGNVVKELAPKLIDGIVYLVNEAVKELPSILKKAVPKLLKAAFDLINQLVESITQNVQPLVEMVVTLLNDIVTFISQNLPILIKAAIQIVLELAKGIVNTLSNTEFISSIIRVILEIVEILLENIDKVIDAGIDIMMALIEGLISQGIPILIEKAPIIIIKLIAAVIKTIPKILTLGPKIIGAIVKGIIGALGKILDIGEKLLEKLGEMVKGIWESIKEVGGKILEGIIDGIKNAPGKIWDGLKGVGKKLVGKIKGVFGIHSPSKLAKDEIGYWIGAGINEGISEGLEETQKQVYSAMTQLGNGIDTSVNPTINPTANTNPLILQIENFYNNRETDIQKLSEELEFYRKRSATAKGGY